jgi:hypothetical protein
MLEPVERSRQDRPTFVNDLLVIFVNDLLVIKEADAE